MSQGWSGVLGSGLAGLARLGGGVGLAAGGFRVSGGRAPGAGRDRNASNARAGPNTGVSEGVQGGSATRYAGHLGLACQLLLMHPHALQGVQVDEHVDQGILVDNGGLAAQPGPLDAEFNGLAI